LVGVMRFDFTPRVHEREIELERGVPAMLLVIGNFVAVALSWPRMPMRAAKRCIREYVKEAVEQAHILSENNAGQLVDVAIAFNFAGLPILQIEELAKCSHCTVTAHNGNCVFVPAGRTMSEHFSVSECSECKTSVFVVNTQVSSEDARSVVQPARTDTSGAAQPQAEITLQEDTPLYDNLLDCLQGTDTAKEIVDFIANICFYGDHCYVDERGNKLDTPRSVGSRMEIMMKDVLLQRYNHVRRLYHASDPRVLQLTRVRALTTLEFTADDMSTIMMSWEKDACTWMNLDTFAKRSGNKNWKRIRHSHFSVYQQHISGCKFLLRSLIMLPILAPESSVEQPAGNAGSSYRILAQPEKLLEVMRSHRAAMDSDGHAAAVQRSQPSNQIRLGVRLHKVQRQLKVAFMLSREVEDGTLDFKDLSPDKQAMIEDYDARRGLWKQREILLAEQAANAKPYRGAAVVLEL
jgi:hypothetical protein